MIKAFAVTLLIAAMGNSISEFSLSPEESFTLHADHDYVFSLEQCGSDCVALRVTQIVKGTPQWTGQFFDLQEGKQYPLQMNFDDVVFDSVYVVSVGDIITLRVSYREVSAPSQQRVVKATSEKNTVEKVSFLIIGEVSAVILLIFFLAHRFFHRRAKTEEAPQDAPQIPRAAVGFHDSWETGIPRRHETDPDLDLLQHIKDMERLREKELQWRMKRKFDEEESLGIDWI